MFGLDRPRRPGDWGLVVEHGLVGEEARDQLAGQDAAGERDVGRFDLHPRPAQGLATPPACLQELLPDMDAPQALLRVAPALVRDVQRFEAEGWSSFLPAFRARDVLRGRDVLLSDGTQGQAMGVDEVGALRVHTAAGLRRVNSAEVSVRPSP